MLIRPALALLAALLGTVALASPPDPLDPFLEITPTTCGAQTAYMPVVAPLPPMVSGRVAFYAAEYEPRSGRVVQAAGLGNVGEVHPLASAYKGLLVEAALRDVDAGILKLSTPLTTTAATRSIEAFPAGTNSLQVLAQRAIQRSDNTAADLLHRAYGPARLSRLIHARSPCTAVLLTGKAVWAAQGGLLPGVLGPDMPQGAAAYAQAPFEQRVALAAQLNHAALGVTGPDVEAALDRWFRGLAYVAQVDLDLQPTSTAKALTDLVARTYGGTNLTTTRTLYRQIMATGCCRPKVPRLQTRYWGAKAGSGWRYLTLTGYVELPGGRVLAYSYLNDLSDIGDSEVLEGQIRPVLAWIEGVLLELAAAHP